MREGCCFFVRGGGSVVVVVVVVVAAIDTTAEATNALLVSECNYNATSVCCFKPLSDSHSCKPLSLSLSFSSLLDFL